MCQNGTAKSAKIYVPNVEGTKSARITDSVSIAVCSLLYVVRETKGCLYLEKMCCKARQEAIIPKFMSSPARKFFLFRNFYTF